MTPSLAVTFLLLIGLLTLVSYVDRVYVEMGKFLSREFLENIEVFEQRVEPRLGASRTRAQLSMAVLTQLTLAAIALLVGYVVFYDGKWNIPEILQAALVIVLVVIVCNRFLPFVFFTRTHGEFLIPFAPLLRMLIYAVLPVTVVLGFCLSVAALAEQQEPEAPEGPAEAVDALIEAGQEEGILKESDRDLIHSVVDFREKTVRDVMTSRPEVVAVPVDATVEQLIELQRTKPYSRVPVYEGTLDQVKGIVFAQDVLQVPDSEARAATVGKLMKPAQFVPESKRVGELFRELQRDNVHMAVVIDEYGNVAGVVTIEDLLEEIVGEIRDEHEAKADIVRESESSYVVPGNMDLDRLDDLFGVRPEARGAATVAGLVSELLGRIPQPGEVVEDDGLRFEILQSTGRRIERLRVTTRPPSQKRRAAT